MLFNSLTFFTAFVCVLLLYYIVPKKMQWVYLLVVSYAYYFYLSKWYVLLLLSSTIITWAAARFMDLNRGKRKLWLVLCVVLNIGILFFFKYSPWLLNSMQGIGITVPTFSLLVPVGISFYTFKVVGYIIDVYRGKISSEENLGKYALFVSFFPQIVSGPIERSYNFIPQMEDGHRFDYDRVKDGFLLYLWGLLKKIVIADRLGFIVDNVFNNLGKYNSLSYFIAIFFFTMQIYFDFAGYSDMAIGCTNMLGITSIKNFDRPYFAQSVGEFWRRWHISLSTWFRDYLYIPLGGNRVSKARWAMNTMIVFLTSGLWHGANWTFLVWGALHGVYQVIGKFTRTGRDQVLEKVHIKKESRLYSIGAKIVTFILVAYAWMFFRANSIGDAIEITKSLFVWNATGWNIWGATMTDKGEFLLSIALIAGWFILELIQARVNLRKWLQQRCVPIRWGIYLTIMFTCILFGKYGSLSASSFIYFQF